MMKYIKRYNFLLSIFLLIIFLCCKPCIDVNYAASIVKSRLGLTSCITTEELKCGLSGTRLFKVTSAAEIYVIRFMNPTLDIPALRTEINAYQQAAAYGHGPHFYCADESQAFIILEYLEETPITEEIAKTDNLYIYLGRLLHQLHDSPTLPTSRDYISKIDNQLSFLEKLPPAGIPIKTIKKIIAAIKPIIIPHLISEPCHNDLTPHNLIFMGNEFRAIDYELAAQADPYFDLATVILFYCANDPHHEQVLIHTYLGRNPTAQESAKLYLVKQITKLYWALLFLKRAPATLHTYDNINTADLEEFFGQRELFAQPDFNDQALKIPLAKFWINRIIAQADMPAFSNALRLLQP